MNIKNCPFCGEDDVQIDDVGDGRIAVLCPECECVGPLGNSIEQAIAKWNGAASQTEPIAALRTAERFIADDLDAYTRSLAGPEQPFRLPATSPPDITQDLIEGAR